ncbi:Gti1/Pac2 family-domain-containing protein [Daldinia sp. FL1419]|nr:Gti1/Pac2 family-domain-containing protein [Daldinia sp. FL1419]
MSAGGIMSGVDRAAVNGGGPLQPTFQGYIGSTMDALILFEACLCGRLRHVPRRPHDRERSNLIVSGNVFIYEEHSSGIKRWTDGVPWSPSRILGNFLLYRELDKPFQPGEKKRAMKRQKPDSAISKPQSHSRSSSVGNYGTALRGGGLSMSNLDGTVNARNDTERALVGSLIDSYQFKPEGLVKKTISVTYQGIQHHMVSYYTLHDVTHSRLLTPGQHDDLRGIIPRAPLVSSGSFRAPVDDHEFVLTDHHLRGAINSSYYGNRSLSVPSLQVFDQGSWPNPGQYAVPYTIGPTLPPVSYQSASTYNYDNGATMQYGIPQPALPYNQPTPMPPRRHSTMTGVSGIGSIDYSTFPQLDRTPMSSAQLLGNDNNTAGHDLSNQSSYSNGIMFETSAAAAAAAVENTPSDTNQDVYGQDGPSSNGDLYNPDINNLPATNNGTHNGTHNPDTDDPSGMNNNAMNGFRYS